MSLVPRVVSTIREEDEDEPPEQEHSSLWEEIPPEDDNRICEEDDVPSGPAVSPGLHKSGRQYIPDRGFSRYDSSLRNLILIRRKKKKKGTIGVDEAGLLSFITFSWLSSYMYRAYKRPFTLDDIPEPSPYDNCDYTVQRLEVMWLHELTRKGPKSASLGWVTWRFMRTRIILASILYILYIVCCFISIGFCMRGLLEYIESEDGSYLVGAKWAVLLTFVELLRVTLYSTVWGINYRTGIRLRSACMTMLYRKILRLTSLGDKSVGELINLYSNDGQRIVDFILFGPMIIGGPVSMIFCIGYIYWYLSGWAALGMAVFFLFYPIQYGLSRLSGYIKRKALTFTDKRLSFMTELLQTIKIIKLNVWEHFFSKKILDIRKKELRLVRRTAYCQSLSSSMSSTAPVITAIVVFLVHIAAGYSLSASQAFTVMAFCLKLLKIVLTGTRDGFRSIVDYRITLRRLKAFPLMSMILTHMRLSFWYLHLGLSNIIDHTISCDRFKSVLLLNETKIYYSRSLDNSQAISIAQATFVRHHRQEEDGSKHCRKKPHRKYVTGKMNSEPECMKLSVDPSELSQEVLFDINFYAPKGKLIGICGQVGSGKSSLLSAILGQLPMTKGKLCKDGTFAYVSQEPWLLNATLKDNILFGEQFVAKRYFNAIYCCNLNDDINMLPGGDDTEIGERGINLSGGQKQRIALARALYSDRDIYLLDNLLSSIDARVRSDIFRKCIKNALHKKTVLLVTHELQFLRECDDIIVLKSGRIIERGSYDELLMEDGEFKSLIGSCLDFEVSPMYPNDENGSEIKANNESNEMLKNGAKSEQGVLIQEEKVQTGSVRFQTLLSYLRASGGIIISILVILLMLVHVGSTAFSSWWLAQWLKDGSGNTTIEVNNATVVSTNIADNPQFSTYYLVYSLCIIVILVTNLLRGFIFTRVTLRASNVFHKNLFDKLLKSPLVFFETTPIGRIQNLLSKDIAEIETYLPTSLEGMIQGIWQLAFAVFFICLVFPYFVLPLFGLTILYYFISKIFRAGIRDLKRMENLSRSPIFGVVSTTVHGLDTIHAFEKEKDFIDKFTSTFDLNSTCLYLYSVGTRWLALRLDILAVFIVAITSALMIIFQGEVPPAMAGLAIAYATTISGIFQYTVRLHSECESRMLSVERINCYTHSLEQEGGHGPKGVPPETWPELGTIRFSHVHLRYRPELQNVLDDVSFKVRPAEKIGIVGRTGSGKSSLTTALFRLVDLSQGSIKVDNIDTSTMNVSLLRNRLTIVPQEPVLFTNTIRKNVDPGEKYADEEIWSALEKVGLKDRVSSYNTKLDTQVSTSGENFSVGEKQLLCLARALLKKTKILVFDEVTSGVDPETEKAVLKAIYDHFKQCTILTISHRLETVLSCDRVLVMDKGQVVEFDEPTSLLRNQNSVFSKMMAASCRAEGY